MYKKKRIACLVPAYNEENHIKKVILTMPNFVDKIIVIDDASTDRTWNIINSIKEKKLISVKHKKNRGVGGAFKTGFKQAKKHDIDICVFIAGDGQFPPEYIKPLIDKLLQGKYDLVHGNRLILKKELKKMPMLRRIGNITLTLLNKIATGYWNYSDPQSGYSAILRKSYEELDINSLVEGYQWENSLLVELSIKNKRVGEIPIRATYGDEESKINIFKFIPRTAKYLTKAYIKRIKIKYYSQGLHPMMFFFILGILSAIGATLLLTLNILKVTKNSNLFIVLPLIFSTQFLLTAFLIDYIESQKK